MCFGCLDFGYWNSEFRVYGFGRFFGSGFGCWMFDFEFGGWEFGLWILKCVSIGYLADLLRWTAKPEARQPRQTWKVIHPIPLAWPRHCPRPSAVHCSPHGFQVFGRNLRSDRFAILVSTAVHFWELRLVLQDVCRELVRGGFNF